MNRISRTSRFLCMLLAVALLLAVGHGITRAGQRAGKAFEPVRLVTGLFGRLNLTGEQRAAIRAVFEAHATDLTTLVERELAARGALLQAIHQPEVNEPAVRLASRAVAAADADFAVERAEMFTEIAPILTDEQKAEIAAFTERVRALLQTDLERSVGPKAGLNRLNLTDEQRAAIRTILESHRPALEAFAVQELDVRTALIAAIRQPSVNEEAVRSASAAVAAVDVELAVERARISAEIEDVLTDEQKAKIASVRARLAESLASRGQLAFDVAMKLLV